MDGRVDGWMTEGNLLEKILGLKTRRETRFSHLTARATKAKRIACFASLAQGHRTSPAEFHPTEGTHF